MAKQDGTGPLGHGAMTGRGCGPCGSGMKRGYGRGFGFRQRPLILAKDEQKKILEAELKDIETERQAIETKLKEMG